MSKLLQMLLECCCISPMKKRHLLDDGDDKRAEVALQEVEDEFDDFELQKESMHHSGENRGGYVKETGKIDLKEEENAKERTHEIVSVSNTTFAADDLRNPLPKYSKKRHAQGLDSKNAVVTARSGQSRFQKNSRFSKVSRF